ncbi:hypothetical protein PR048_031752 [Dryococelus australis]|uniref:Uncharacterized protein n=1 Tax=Dryococelus australis TaxID=614101 RepID=A0ABQ9G930_9NEOP|nr:hypothetical protein PR048_031752 [Dryococelus australis]
MSDIDDNLVSVGEANDGARKITVNPRRRDIAKAKKYGQPRGCNTLIPCRLNPSRPTERRRSLSTSKTKRPNTTSVVCHLITKSKHRLPVCKKLFMKVMLVKPSRLRNICQAKYKAVHLVEKRGGDCKSHKSAAKRLSVTAFIMKLKGKESHYSRNNSKRIYLDPTSYVSKLWRIYNDSQPKIVRK